VYKRQNLLEFELLEYQPPVPYDPWYAGYFDARGGRLELDISEPEKASMQLSWYDWESSWHDPSYGAMLNPKDPLTRNSNPECPLTQPIRGKALETFWRQLRSHLRSTAGRRFFMLSRFNQLQQLGAHLPQSPHAADWELFLKAWREHLALYGESFPHGHSATLDPPKGAQPVDFRSDPEEARQFWRAQKTHKS
jgi:hypothetical protein